MKKLKVYIVCSDMSYERMFRNWGWDFVDNIEDADLIQFTGGADVHPSLYGHTIHPTTMYNVERDTKEALVFKIARSYNKPMAGICRGGQFLNVMCGGQMWQDVVGHTCGWHNAIDVRTGETFGVTSTHHQMMIPGEGAEILLIAKGVAKKKIKTNIPNEQPSTIIDYNGDGEDIEALLYREKKCLCFQPHPEYVQKSNTLSEVYMEYLCEFFGFKVPGIPG